MPRTRRTKALRVAHRDQLVLGEHRQRVRALHLRQRLDDALDDSRRVRGRNQMNDDFAVRGRLENRAARLQPVAELGEIHQVAVMRDRNSAARIFNDQRLAILDGGRAGGRVAIVPDGAGAFEFAQHVLVEDVGDQSHPAMRDQRFAVGRDDTGRLLPMLQTVQAEICEIGGLGMPVDAESRTPRGSCRGWIPLGRGSIPALIPP